IPSGKRETQYPWRDAVRPRSLPRGLLPFLILVIFQDIVLIVLVRILHGVIQFEKIVLFLLVLLFIEAFQRRFEGLRILLLYVLEGCWDERYLGLLIYVGNSSRMVQGLVDCGQEMTQAKVLGGKRVPYLTRPRIQGMARNTRLHPNRTDLLPKMLLGIADDLLGDVLR